VAVSAHALIDSHENRKGQRPLDAGYREVGPHRSTHGTRAVEALRRATAPAGRAPCRTLTPRATSPGRNAHTVSATVVANIRAIPNQQSRGYE
jgi:hypothetical protein